MTDRYELLDTIATGDFATVHRARDRELGREVAVKQIHAQFLHDERQLARYWQEAQLLASLQHPHVLTIYDIVRSRGWLVLELMRGSLRQAVETGPLDLDFLRISLACALSALHFLHGNGVVHGDVKPGNLLVDGQNRVKLGDFGLARRGTSDEGSLLKGTTKYMAPELLSNQFGPVGPASDLYSLGFTAYELMCGPEFENLFPGLSSFGRDKQLAWMMWHAAPDRTMPEIGRVLHGVPPDLARVIQRLVVKDQAQRYHSAREAIEDLRADQRTAPVQAAAPPPSPPKRGRKYLVAAAVVASLVVAAILLIPARGGRRPLQAPPAAIRGVVRNVFADERKFSLESSDDGRALEVRVRTGDPIFVNGKSQLIYDLRPGDRVSLRTLFDAAGRPITEVHATREEITRGVIHAVLASQGKIVLRPEGDAKTQEMSIDVPTSAAVLLNGKTQFENHPVKLADLKPGDRAEAAWLSDPTGRKATRLAAERVVSFRGVLRAGDPQRREFTFALGPGDDAQLVTLPLADACEVTLNNQRNLHQRLVGPADLQPGDDVTVQHDAKIVRLDARRVFRASGSVQKIDYSTRLLEVLVQGRPAAVTYLAAPDYAVELAGGRATIEDLRLGDAVEVTFDTPDARIAEARSIVAQRAPDPRRWALLLAGGKFEDATVSELGHAENDASLVRDALVKRYRTPAEQLLLLANENLVRLEQGIPKFLARLKPDGRLIVYVVGRAYRDSDGQVYLAPQNFDLRRMSSTGLKLQWLVDQLEQCAAGEKLLLVDACHVGDKADLAAEPSSAEMIRSLKPPTPGLPPLRTVTAVAGCRAGQRGLTLADGTAGLMASCVASAYSGAADRNRDSQVEPTELLSYLETAMADAARSQGKEQSPELFLPDSRPPRLSENAKKAIRILAAFLRQTRTDMEKVNVQYVTTEQLAGKEIEPKLLYGLLLMRAKHRDEAMRRFEEIHLDRPGDLVAGQAIAWLHFDRTACQAGVDALAEMVGRLKPPKTPAEPIGDDLRQAFFWAGQLRQYATDAAAEARRASESSAARLDAAVAAQGAEASQSYAEGRAKTRAVMAQFDKQIAEADEVAAARLRIQRRLLNNYATFPFEEAARRILDGLE